MLSLQLVDQAWTPACAHHGHGSLDDRCLAALCEVEVVALLFARFQSLLDSGRTLNFLGAEQGDFSLNQVHCQSGCVCQKKKIHRLLFIHNLSQFGNLAGLLIGMKVSVENQSLLPVLLLFL